MSSDEAEDKGPLLCQVETLPIAVLRDIIAIMPPSVILSVSQRQLPAVLAAAVARAIREGSG